MGGGVNVFPEVWHTIYFTVDELMASTLVERLYVGGIRMGFSYILVNRRWLDLP